MQFKEALKKAGLQNPGRTTWCGVAVDGVPVFTIWTSDIHRIGDRFFAWWSHPNLETEPHPVDRTAHHQGRQRTFITLADANKGRACRAVILHRKPGTDSVGDAVYPDPRMARVDFRIVDVDALQFIAELLPND